MSRVTPSGPLALMREMKKRLPRCMRLKLFFWRSEKALPAEISGIASPIEPKLIVSKLMTWNSMSSRPSSMAACN